MTRMTEDEEAVIRMLGSLPEENRKRLFQLATMPEKNWNLIVGLSDQKMFWAGVIATVAAIGTVFGWLISVAPDRAGDVVDAATRQHSP